MIAGQHVDPGRRPIPGGNQSVELVSDDEPIDPRRSGTDADAIFLQKGGIATVAIGVPNRYMHTPVEAVHLKDLENLALLLTAFILDLKPRETFKVKI